jgi:hypothetical protein
MIGVRNTRTSAFPAINKKAETIGRTVNIMYLDIIIVIVMIIYSRKGILHERIL